MALKPDTMAPAKAVMGEVNMVNVPRTAATWRRGHRQLPAPAALRRAERVVMAAAAQLCLLAAGLWKFTLVVSWRYFAVGVACGLIGGLGLFACISMRAAGTMPASLFRRPLLAIQMAALSRSRPAAPSRGQRRS